VFFLSEFATRLGEEHRFDQPPALRDQQAALPRLGFFSTRSGFFAGSSCCVTNRAVQRLIGFWPVPRNPSIDWWQIAGCLDPSKPQHALVNDTVIVSRRRLPDLVDCVMVREIVTVSDRRRSRYHN